MTPRFLGFIRQTSNLREELPSNSFKSLLRYGEGLLTELSQ
jgi:hypothetical protein